MIRRYWVLGSALRLDEVASAVEEQFDLRLETHESDYRGGAYLRGASEALTDVIVQENFVDEDGDLLEPEFSTARTLIYLTQSVEAAHLQVDGRQFRVLRMDEK